MEQSEVDKSCPGSEDGGLARNRSFKSKQLVRSQAIRESTSPPRTVSPYAKDNEKHTPNDISASERDNSDASSHSDRCSVINNDRLCDKKQPVEIQITSGTWETESQTEQRLRTRRWLGHRPHSDSSRDLLSYNARVACVCGACACPHCRGRRKKHVCPTKQDSGIVCSEDCPDCTDTDHNGPISSAGKKSGSFDAEDQTFYCRCPERKEKPKSYSLSGSDFEAEPTVPELVSFIKETLNKNAKDRMTMLRIEKELHSLVNDNGRCIVRFPVMTSYGRMLVHRCAALFQLAHHLDHSNKNSVLVSKSGTSGGRIPCTSFRQWCTTVFPQESPRHEDTLAKSILKRSDAHNFAPSAAAGRSKSLEQREKEYERVRRRIFSTDNCTQDEWPWLTGQVKLLTPDTGRNKLLKVQSLESGGGAEPVQRGAVSKSHSFGGYTADGLQPQPHALQHPQHRLLSRQGDLASSSWRLSPSSSGYKTLSLRSTDSVTPSPTGGASPEPHLDGATFLWAVTDMSAVPPGALVIHPQTGRALTNPDGTLYHFDPGNPPLLYDASAYIHDNVLEHKEEVDTNNEKRRGKLEKQHSFIDNECDCQPSEECRVKCCCECRRHDVCQKNSSEKGSPQKVKSASNPVSPVKNRHEPKPITPEPKPELQTETETECETTESQEVLQPNESINYEAVNQNRFESPHQMSKESNQMSFDSNQRSFDSNQRSYDSNQRSFDSNQRSFDLHQKPFERYNSFEQRKEEVYPQNYVQSYGNEEIISPSLGIGGVSYTQQQQGLEAQLVQHQMTPVPLPDATLRPMSLTNVMYGATVPQPNVYPQYLNTCRIEQPLQPGGVYQQLVQAPEEQKPLTSSPHNENTFRIDPSYPYAADFNAACGACDPSTLQPQRGYNVPYTAIGQVEVQGGLMPQYSMPNMLIHQPIQPYPYQEQMALQWQGVQQPVAMGAPGKYVVHDVYPLVYPNQYQYQPYNLVYPQVVPQAYPVVQPVYMDKQPEIQRNIPRPKRNPSRCDEDRKYEEMKHDQHIQMKLQQIKDQMSHVNIRDKRSEWRSRNSGTGILGSYPVSFNGTVVGAPPTEDNQLSSAARAIVNSIRNLQKNNYNTPRQYAPRPDRADTRPRRDDERRDRPATGQLYRPACVIRQMSPGTWCRRSPGPLPSGFNQPRRPYPDSRNGRR